MTLGGGFYFFFPFQDVKTRSRASGGTSSWSEDQRGTRQDWDPSPRALQDGTAWHTLRIRERHTLGLCSQFMILKKYLLSVYEKKIILKSSQPGGAKAVLGGYGDICIQDTSIYLGCNNV